MNFKFYTFPKLKTDRLTLRKLEIHDLSSFVKNANNKKISDQILNMPFPFREPDAAFKIGKVVQGFKNKNRIVFSIIHNDSDEMIGEVALHILDNHKGELGYWIGEPYWGKGLMTEAVAAVKSFGFDQLELDTIYASCYSDNLGSIRVLVKNGFLSLKTINNLLEYGCQNPNLSC